MGEGEKAPVQALKGAHVLKIGPCKAILLWHLDGEPCATAAHAAQKDAAAVFRLEARTKTMRRGALFLFRLVGPFHRGWKLEVGG